MTCQLARGYFGPVHAKYLRHLLGWPVLVTGLLASCYALADDSDPSAIEQRLKALETTEERKVLVQEPAAQARKAMKRVLDARAAGDAAHAVELAALANEWVNLAANVIRAAELEQEVSKAQARLSELEQKRRRTETLLEATIAQRERTREELKRSSPSALAGSQPPSPQKAASARVAEAASAKVHAASKAANGVGAPKPNETATPPTTAPAASSHTRTDSAAEKHPSTSSRGK